MTARQLVELLCLGALWGASFLFMRIGAPQFGPIVLIGLRVAIAAVFLLLVLASRGRLRALAASPRRRELIVVGLFNSALPFCLFAYAALSITAGLNSILNSTAPLWTALVAYLWLGQRLSVARMAGLALGVAGVAVLVRSGSGSGLAGSAPAIAAGLLASLCYGFAANYTKRYLTQESPWVVAAGSQLTAALLLAPLVLLQWPSTPVSALAWFSVIALGVASTGLAYILYFRLIVSVGPAQAATVALLIPIFGCAWGAILLDETITRGMLVGGAVVLLGTALATGILGRRGSAQTR